MLSGLKRPLLIAGLALFTTMAFAEVTPESMAARIRQLAPLEEKGLDIQALQREVGYELQNLPVSERARLEAQIIFSRIQSATVKAYDLAMEETGSEAESLKLVREYVEGDLSQMDTSISPFIKETTEKVLANDAFASVPETEFPEPFLKKLEASSIARQEILSQESFGAVEAASENKEKANPSAGSGLRTASRGIRSYKTKADLIRALVSGDESERWVATANMSVRSGRITGAEVEVSMQVKVEFLGSEVSAGPILQFSLTTTTQVDIKGEGMYPLFDTQGLFDLNWKDMNGANVVTDGRVQRRFIFFTCDAETRIQTEVAAGGSLKAFGVGGEAKGFKAWDNSVTLSSRRMLVPDTVDGRQVSLRILANVCHNDFLNARVQNGRTVRQNMQTTLLNMASSLVYSNPGTQCVRNDHCNNWFNRKLGINKIKVAPRCIQAVGNAGIMTCQTRGLVGAVCPVYVKGRLQSTGIFETPCDAGLRCVTIMPGLSNPIPYMPPISYATGVCQAVPTPRRR